MRSDWILFTLLALLWIGAGGVHLKWPRRTKRDMAAHELGGNNEG